MSEDEDDRKPCDECQNLKAGRSQQARAAGLSQWASIEIGRDLAGLLQRCPAFKAKENR